LKKSTNRSRVRLVRRCWISSAIKYFSLVYNRHLKQPKGYQSIILSYSHCLMLLNDGQLNQPNLSLMIFWRNRRLRKSLSTR